MSSEGYQGRETMRQIDDPILVERSQFCLVPSVGWKSRETGKRKHRLAHHSPTYAVRVVKHR